MDKAKISFFIKDYSNEYVAATQAYAGTYTGDEPLQFTLRIWNNYKGTEIVKDLNNFNIVLSFANKEDSVLLPYLTMAIDNRVEIPVNVVSETAVGTFLEKTVLSGAVNDGSSTYTNNYIDIVISFTMDDSSTLKDHDLKSLFIELVEL